MSNRSKPKNFSSHSHHESRIVIGIHSAREALKVRPKKIRELWLQIGADRHSELKEFIEVAKRANIKVRFQPDGQLDKIAANHQGVVLFVDESPEFDSSLIESGRDREKIILVALDQVTDPHNIGAVLRTAWLFGSKGLLVPKNRSGGLTPAAIKVASGGAEHVPLVAVDNLAQELTSLKDKGFWIYGLDAAAASPLQKTRFHERVVLVIGAEDKGLRSTTRNVCDELVAIPQIEPGASLNASVATAVALYEVIRQHDQAEQCSTLGSSADDQTP